MKLRVSIQKSVEQQLRFVSKLGASQVEQDMLQKVKHLTKRVANQSLEEASGVTVPMEDEEVDRYMKIVNEEKERLSKKKDESS